MINWPSTKLGSVMKREKKQKKCRNTDSEGQVENKKCVKRNLRHSDFLKRCQTCKHSAGRSHSLRYLSGKALEATAVGAQELGWVETVIISREDTSKRKLKCNNLQLIKSFTKSVTMVSILQLHSRAKFCSLISTASGTGITVRVGREEVSKSFGQIKLVMLFKFIDS